MSPLKHIYINISNSCQSTVFSHSRQNTYVAQYVITASVVLAVVTNKIHRGFLETFDGPGQNCNDYRKIANYVKINISGNKRTFSASVLLVECQEGISQ